LAVLAGYVVLLLVNRQLSARLRLDRHQAQVQATTQALQQLMPEQLSSSAAPSNSNVIWPISPALPCWCGWCGWSQATVVPVR
jgi:sensor domain CHASE-containing protein